MLVLNGERAPSSLAFTPDGTRLVVGASGGGLLDVWTLASGTRAEIPASKTKLDPVLTMHPAGRVVFVAGDQPLLGVSLDGRAHDAYGFGDVRAAIVSPDGEWVIAGPSSKYQKGVVANQCRSDGTARGNHVWAAKPHTYQEIPAGFIGTGEQFVAVDQRTIVIRDTATGEERSTVRYPSYYIRNPTTSPDGSRFAVMGYGKFYLWNTTAWGKPKRVECNSSSGFVSFAFHPKRPLLAAIQWRQTLVKFLDADTGKVTSKFQWKLGEMKCVAFSPDGTLAAAGSASGNIVVWDVD